MLLGLRRRRGHRGLLTLVVLVVLVAACRGGSDPAPASTTSAPPTTAPAPTAVVLTGDSVMHQVASAIVDALGGTEAELTFASTIAVAGRAETVAGWQTVLAVDPPDLVVIMVGTWELDAVRAGRATGPWPQAYHDQVAPLLDALHQAGTEVVWSTYPPADGEQADDVVALNEAVLSLPDRFPDVTVVDAAATITGPGGSLVRTTTGVDGVERVVRDLGVHLCPDGVVHVARPLVDELAGRMGRAARPGWEGGAWRSDPALFTDPAACGE